MADFVLLHGGDPGRRADVINTGPPQDLSQMNQQWSSYAGPRCQMIRQEAERPASALATLGIAPDEVDYVLITPLQSYATGNIPLFRNAQVCISRRGWIEDFHAPTFPLHSPTMFLSIWKFKRPASFACSPMRSRYCQDYNLFLDWRPSSFFHPYSVETAKGRVVVTDAAFHYGNLERPHPLGILESMEECNIAYDRIYRGSKVAIPLYDPEALQRFPGGKVA